MKVYRVGRRGSGNYGPWVASPATAVELLVGRVRDRGPYRVKERGGEYGREVGLPAMKRQASRLLEPMDEDGAVWVQTSPHNVIFVIDVGNIRLDPVPPAPSGVSPAIERVHNFMFKEVQRIGVRDDETLRIVTKGYTVCKWINARVGGTPSQHSPGPPTPVGGNAVDGIVQKKAGERWVTDIEATDELVRKLQTKGYVAHVLWRGVLNHYPGHFHVSGSPLRQGVPVCL